MGGQRCALAEHASGARPVPPFLILLTPLVLVGIVVVMPLLHPGLYESTPWLRTARWLLLSLFVVLLILLISVIWRRRDSSRHQSQLPGRRFGLVAAAVLLPMAFLYVDGFRPIAYSPSAEKRMLLAFLGTLPKDVLLAGDRCTLDDVPFYARRSVVFNCEIYQGDTLIVDTLRAYYATDPAALASYCRQYGVDYLVTDSMSLTADAVATGSYFLRPYTDMLAEELAGREAFYLAEPATKDSVFESGPYRVVACPGGEP